MLANKLRKNRTRMMQRVDAMGEDYNSHCKSSDAGGTQAKGLVISGAQSKASLENFLSEIISKTVLEELAKDRRWQESKDGPVRGVIERFFSDLADVWDHTPTGAWAEVGLRQRQEKIRGCLSSLLEVYGVDADAQAQKHQQAIAGAVRLIDYVGMTGAAVSSASAAQASGYNARIIEAERGYTGLFLNKLGFSTCPKKEAAVKALLTDKAAQYPVTALPAGSEQVFCRGAEAVESIIANTGGLAPLQQFSHLTDSQDRTRVQYHNIKALLACWPYIENNQDASKAVTLMLGVIVEDMLIESTATISIEGKQKPSRAVCAERAKALLSGMDLDEDAIYAQILVWAKDDRQGAAKGKETSLVDVTRCQDAQWWQICKQKIFTPHAAIQALLERQSGVSADQSSMHKLLSSFLSTIEKIRPTGVPSDACWFTMAGMMAIVEKAAEHTAQSVIGDEGSYKSLNRQQASALLQLCANDYLIPVYVQRSGVAYQELFASIESIKQSVESMGQSQVADFQKLTRVIVYQDLFKGQDGFQEAYHAYKNSITSHTGTYEQVNENIKANILGAPEKDDAVLQAVGEIIKTTNKWSSVREAQVRAEQAADAVVSAGFAGQGAGDSSAAHIRDEVSSSSSLIGLSSSEQGAPSVGVPILPALGRGKSVEQQVVPPKVPVVEKILMQDQAGATMPAVKVLYTNSDKHDKIKDLESVLQQAYSKKVWDRWGEANRLSIPNLAAGVSCLTCLAMAGWSWMTGDIIGLTLNITTVVLVSWYAKKAYQNAVTELQKIPSTYLSELSEQGVITGQLDHKNWAWNKPEQRQPKGGFSVRSLLGYAALLTPCILVAVLILKVKGWISLGILGLKSLTGLARVAPVQATQFTKHMGQIGKALGSANLIEKGGSSLAPR